jgi:hypothetical protein
VVAADAGPMGIEWIGGTVWRSAESAERSRTENVEGETVVGEASCWTVDGREEREEEIDGAGRRRSTPSAKRPKTFGMSMVISCGNGDRKRWRAELDFGSRESLVPVARRRKSSDEPEALGFLGSGVYLHGTHLGEPQRTCRGRRGLAP